VRFSLLIPALLLLFSDMVLPGAAGWAFQDDTRKTAFSVDEPASPKVTVAVDAEEEEVAPEDLEAAEEEPDTLLERGLEAIEEGHERISERVVALGRWLDSFFGDERIAEEAQRTHFTLGISLFAEEAERTSYDMRGNFRLSLPMLSERWQLVISGDPEEEVGADPVTREGIRGRFRETRDQQVTAGVRYRILSTLHRHLSVRTGLRVRSGTPVLLLEPRYRHEFPEDIWLFRFTQRVAGFTDGTLEIRTLLDAERPLPELSDKFFFRTTAEGAWFSDEEGYFYNFHVVLFHAVSQRRAMQYVWSNHFQTRPSNRLERSWLRLIYRQRIGWDWLYYEVAPHIAFPHGRDHRLTHGIILRLEAVFGAYD
jgi:hypothetical protein